MAKIIPLASPRSESSCLPDVFRVESLRRKSFQNGQTRHDATILCEPHRYQVHFESVANAKLCVGDLVSIEWAGWPLDDDDTVSIGDLIPVTEPNPKTNLFQTIPARWVPERHLVERGAEIWKQLSPGFQHLFNAIFWSPSRFEKFVRGPSSRAHHHNRRHGNLTHSLEVAAMAMDLAKYSHLVDREVVVMAALLHDAAKSEEYVLDMDGTHQFWSEEGSLIGHRLMAFGWVEAAMAVHPIAIPVRQILALKHALVATEGIASWTAFPEPRMLESKVLAVADRLSAMMDLYAGLAPDEAGFGPKHWTMKHAPYFSVAGQNTGGI